MELIWCSISPPPNCLQVDRFRTVLPEP
uniref:Uncharacterized protein n=1 Tax=Arundo donax TaxID=35708 RepID=A0A0A9B1S8_ARUDO